MGAIAGVILAAGAGRRFGAEKATAKFRGRTFLEGVLAGLKASVNPIVVVVAPDTPETHNHARALGLGIVENPHPERGPISSVGIALNSFLVNAGVEAAMVAPVDQVLVRAATAAALVNRYRAEPGLYVASHRGNRGHPVLIPRALWIAIEEPMGGKTLRDVTADAALVDVEDESVLWNINTREELDKLESSSKP
ncbi:MAG: nucleotidyltransferase family protein [Deltaproteobacteria bacterium]|nr:nucleotidyltransferase family protein [Deltaproteobacteria bacterium]